MYPSPWQRGGSRAAGRGGAAPTPPVTSARPPAAHRPAPAPRPRAPRRVCGRRRGPDDTAPAGCARLAARCPRAFNLWHRWWGGGYGHLRRRCAGACGPVGVRREDSAPPYRIGTANTHGAARRRTDGSAYEREVLRKSAHRQPCRLTSLQGAVVPGSAGEGRRRAAPAGRCRPQRRDPPGPPRRIGPRGRPGRGVCPPPLTFGSPAAARGEARCSAGRAPPAAPGELLPRPAPLLRDLPRARRAARGEPRRPG